jgi:superoxide dismutase, Cu-Zn family
MKRTTVAIGLLAAVLIVLVGFSAQGAEKREAPKNAPAKIMKAEAVVQPTQGNEASGIVMFTQEKTGLRVVAIVQGLTPGVHGFHIHEKGDCSAPDAQSAGGHFNPEGKSHGGPADQERHAGDLGNLEVNFRGKVYQEGVDRVLTLDGPNSIIGRAVVIHADPDDLKTQPAGGSGARVGCGVIRMVDK